MICLERKIPFVDAALGGRVEAATAILSEAEERHGFRLTEPPIGAAEDQRDEWYERHLWPFLSETHLVLAGGDLFATGRGLLDSAGIDRTPAWRQWGAILAEWANAGHWFARPAGSGRTRRSQAARPWEYIDFYMTEYLVPYIDGYVEWRDAVWRVLEAREQEHTAA